MTGAPGAAGGMPDLSSFASLFGAAPTTPVPAPAPAPVFSLSALESAFDTVSESNCVVGLLLILGRKEVIDTSISQIHFCLIRM